MQVDLHSVSFAYPTSDAVLHNLDLTVADGSLHAIVGPNGCGKTTLLRIIAGLEKPTAGSVGFSGTRRHANLTAMVFQTPRLVPWWNVGRNVGIGPEFANVPTGLYQQLRDFFTAHVGLGELIRRLPHTLSRGQQSRAGLGRAFAHDADVMLLDEPFAHIDIPARRRILAEMEATWMKAHRTFVFVTHDIEEAVLLADRISVMATEPGRVLTTIEVDAERPRFGLSPAHPGIRSALSRTWDALAEAS